MQTVKSIWDFFQTELLGMSWLNRLIGDLLNACGLDTAGKVGGSVQFFIYDTIKIMVLLGVLILIISYIQSYFPPERTKKISWCGCKLYRRAARNSNAVLFLFFHSAIYRIYKRGIAAWGYVLISDFFPYGRPRLSCASYEHFRLESRCPLCSAWISDCRCGRHVD